MAAEYDLVIRGGTIVDGTGAPRFSGDLAIADGVIAAVGDVVGSGKEEIDATGRIVTPGFVDIHTHYDGHATWTNRLQPSSQHGVTTVLAGNCGVGFAPCREQDRDRLVALMEGVEDIPEAVMAEGLPWNWESFPDYLDSLQSRSFDIDIATQVPHAPLRVFVMGKRAAEKDPATKEDIDRMAALAREAIEAGALGFSTSRSLNHKANDGTITYSYAAASDELVGIACGVSESGQGVLQLISDFDDVDAEFDIVKRMVQESGRPLSLSLLQSSGNPGNWRKVLDRIESARAQGAPIRAQVAGRPIGLIMGFDFSRHPFMECESWQEVADLQGETRLTEMRRPERRARILGEFAELTAAPAGLAYSNFANLYEMEEHPDYEPSVEDSIEARARREGKNPADLAYDVLVDGTGVIYYPAANYSDNSLDPIRTMVSHEATTFGLGDGGAHCSMICDASLPTYYLERWVRREGDPKGGDRMELEQIVRELTMQTADLVGLGDRGQIRNGLRADLNIINLDDVSLMKPESVADLPNGARRLGQRATGYDMTIVGGEVTYRNGEPTGALPGRLVRGARARLN
ncbi:MAG: amidohydrolase family protein [Sphingomonadaceae bacterium]|nr:amidohydrolase family protein [Sphingomonadaceae bacterium]